MRHYRVLCVAGFRLLSGVVSAIAEPKSAVLAPVGYQRAVLEVHGADGSCAFYSPDDLEKFPTYEIETRTPCREELAVFDGVLLSDVLARQDLIDAPSILVTATNERTTVLEREVWASAPILIATRINRLSIFVWPPHSRSKSGGRGHIVTTNIATGYSNIGARTRRANWTDARGFMSCLGKIRRQGFGFQVCQHLIECLDIGLFVAKPAN